MDWQRAGEFGVDAGICWIGDPCYLSDGRGPMQDWAAFCRRVNDAEDNEVLQCDEGVAVHTGWGDGSYPVYVQRDLSGRVLGVLIAFDDAVLREAGIEPDDDS
jgi:hypothetical protein